MTASRSDTEAIFHAARDIPEPDRRRQYVREACGGDEARIALVEALLAAADRTDSLLDRPLAGPPEATIDRPTTAGPGTVIGPYKLIEPIGEGGMGSVWMAQQTEPGHQPGFKAAQFGLASALAEAKQWDRSTRVYVAALKRFGAPRWPGPWSEAIRSDEVFRRLTAQQPDDRLPRIMRARLRVFERDWKRAAADYARVNESLARIDPAKYSLDSDDLFSYGCLLVLLGDRHGYEQFCKTWADRVGDSPAGGYSLPRAWAVSRCPVVPAQQIVERAEKTLKGGRAPWSLHVLSLAHYRNREFERAIERAEESNGGNWRGSAKALNWVVLAMAHSRLGHAADARQSLQQALELAGRANPGQLPGVEWPKMASQDFVEFELLRREAEELINPQSKGKPDKKSG